MSYPYIIDTPTNLLDHVQRIKAAGVGTVIRYESRLPNAGWKRWQPDEVKALADANIHVAIIYEDNGRPAGYQDGRDAATYAIDRMEARGQPEDSAILYAANDYDAGVDDVNGPIVEYFHGVNDVHALHSPKTRIGGYGSGMVTTVLKEVKLIDIRWLSCSTGFRGTRQALRNGDYELWQAQCDTHLLNIDVDFNTAKVDNYGQFLPWGTIDWTVNGTPPAALTLSPVTVFSSGRGSWYSQFHGKYDWVDRGDDPGSNALGVPDDCQGISFYEHASLGKWFEIHAPNGYIGVEQQTDIGPAPWTGRKIDISSVCAERMGYSPDNFPTNGTFSWRPAPPPPAVAALSPRQQAIKWLQIRQAAG